MGVVRGLGMGVRFVCRIDVKMFGESDFVFVVVEDGTLEAYMERCVVLVNRCVRGLRVLALSHGYECKDDDTAEIDICGDYAQLVRGIIEDVYVVHA